MHVEALDLAVRLVCAGLLIAGVELVLDRAAFAGGGPFDATVYEALRLHPAPSWSAPAGSVVALAGVEVVAAAVVVAVGPMVPIGRGALLVTVAVSLAIRQRRVVGGDGAEQMGEIVLLSAVLALLPAPDDDRMRLVTVFVTAQLTLSYVTAGIAKLVSPVWRAGDALAGILGTYGHGVAWVDRLLGRFPWVGAVAGWTVIAFEVAFPLVLVVPQPIALAVLAIGVTFHVACAALMGLNSFVWAFPAAYPCVVATRELIGRG